MVQSFLDCEECLLRKIFKEFNMFETIFRMFSAFDRDINGMMHVDLDVYTRKDTLITALLWCCAKKKSRQKICRIPSIDMMW